MPTLVSETIEAPNGDRYRLLWKLAFFHPRLCESQAWTFAWSFLVGAVCLVFVVLDSIVARGAAEPNWHFELSSWVQVSFLMMCFFRIFFGFSYFNRDTYQLRTDREPLNWLMKCFWVLYDVSITTNIGLVLPYFLVLSFDPQRPNGITITSHLLFCVFAFADLVLFRVPLQKSHWIFTVLFLLLFFVVSIGQHSWYGLETPVYDKLDWSKKPTQAVLWVFGLAAYFAALHAFLVSLVLCRDVPGDALEHDPPFRAVQLGGA